MATLADLYSARPASRDDFQSQLQAALAGLSGDVKATEGEWGWQGSGEAFEYGQAPTTYSSENLNKFFGGNVNLNPVYDDAKTLTGYTFQSPYSADPYQTNNHTGSWGGMFNTDGSVGDMKWINDDTHGNFLNNYGPAIFAAIAGAGLAGMGGAGAGAAELGAAGAAPISASPITSLGAGASLSDIAAFTGATGATTSSLAAPLAGAGTASAAGASGLSGLTQGAGAAAGGSLLNGTLSKLTNDPVKTIASLLNGLSQNRQGNNQEEWANRLYGDRAAFLERLKQSYEDPNSYLKGPEYQASAGIALDQLQRKDAARGRLATDVQRQKLMQDHALASLDNYRKTLGASAGLTNTTGLAELSTTGLANQYGMGNALLNQLTSASANDFNATDFVKQLMSSFGTGSIYG